MQTTVSSVWDPKLVDPSQQRCQKPRTTGCTMMMDSGLGLHAFQDVLQLSGEYVDFIKLGFGTAAITPRSVLLDKMALAKKQQVHLYPGGTFFEIAFAQNRLDSYFASLKELQFEWVEISDGTISLTPSQRAKAIEQAHLHGLQVITEIGKKAKGFVTPIDHLQFQYEQDRRHGAVYVIVEGREAGKNIGIFDTNGHVNEEYVQQVLERVDNRSLIWEAPQKDQQVQLLQLAGLEVNLGNIPPSELLAVESLRRGLRSDTFSLATSETVSAK